VIQRDKFMARVQAKAAAARPRIERRG